MKTAVCIFARFPEHGKVKTRLAVELGEDATLTLYSELVNHTMREVSTLPTDKFDRLTFVTPDEKRSHFALSFPGCDSYLAQGAGTLGERLTRAVLYAFGERDCRRVILIGTDAPDVTTALLARADHALRESDLVIGPAADGGYYLLGMNNFHDSLLSDVPWGTNAVYATTIAHAMEQRLSMTILPTLRDIDTLADLAYFPTYEKYMRRTVMNNSTERTEEGIHHG